MRTPTRDRIVPWATSALAFAVALAQRPGLATSETKIDLHVDPVGFLGDVASAWSPTGDLGHVQGGQYGGYLFPMGPFFALGRLAGLPPWLVQRLWLGLVLALAAWGMVRLLDALAGRPRGAVHAAGALLYLLNPYVTVFAARTSITLLGYAALPWLLLCVHRGVRSPRSWWWPAAFALVLTSSGGGVNAAVTAWVLVGPLLLVLHEVWVRAVSARGVLAFAWRTTLTSAAASVWWVVPLLVQSRSGVDFLRFTEQPGTIWSTTSLSESLRLMGYWISYLGVGYGGALRPYFSDGGVLLFSWPVVLAGLLVPAVALAGFAWTWRRPAAPFLLALVLVGAVAMAAGFPEGTPLRKGLTFAYNHVAALQFLRTSYKAGPLAALGLAGLGGLAAGELARRLTRPARALAGTAALALAALACWPLATGRALDEQLTWSRIPPAWTAAARHVDRVAGADGRAVVLPGQLYAAYDWGGTVDPILPSLARAPVAVRQSVPYADLHAVDALWSVDTLVQQRRALPGQLGPLLDLLGARTVVSGADDDRSRSGAVPAADAADVLDQLGPADAAWGPVRPRSRTAWTLGGPRALPEVRAWDRPSAQGLVRLEPDGPGTVVDGSADALAGLAAFDALPRGGVRYAGDLGAEAIRHAARGGEVVVSDSNRRRVLVASRMAQNAGPTLPATETPSEDAATLDPFAARGTDAQTIAVYGGIATVRAPSSPGFSQFPERRPFAALDGDPATAWQADRALTHDRQWLEVGLLRPRDIAAVDLLPYGDVRGHVTAVEVAGRRFAVHDGWNHLRLGLRGVRSLRVRIADVAHPPGPSAGAGGIRELRIPGVHATETLRPPVLAERALAGRDLTATGLTYLLQRTTGDDPFRRDPWSGPAGALLTRDRGDAERGLERVLAPPAARTWTADGWGSVAAAAPDPALDRLAGLARGTFASSARFEGRAGWRASSAFDGTPRPWIGSWQPGRIPWIAWTAPRGTTLRALSLAPVSGVRRARTVRLRWETGATSPLAVDARGRVRLPAPARGTRFRLEILRAAFPPGTSGRDRQRRAVGIAELRGAGVPRARVPHRGAVRGRCGDLAGRLGGRPLRLRVSGTVADLDAGRPLRLTGCEPVSLPPRAARLSLPPRAVAPYLLRLRSPAPRPVAVAAAAPGRIVSAGRPARDARTGIRLELRAPARLVLAQGASPGWRAGCDGRDLGAPEVADGFALSWRVPASCRVAGARFAPDRLVRAGYGVSALAVLVLLALLLLRRRPPAPTPGVTPLTRELAARPDRLPARQAAAVAVPAAAVLGFCFAARLVPLFALATFLVLWRGVGVRALAGAAGGLLLVVVPVLMLAVPVRDRGGYNPSYPIHHIAAHWTAVAAVTLLALALGRVLSTARAPRGRAPAAPPRAAARPAPVP